MSDMTVQVQPACVVRVMSDSPSPARALATTGKELCLHIILPEQWCGRVFPTPKDGPSQNKDECSLLVGDIVAALQKKRELCK